MHLGDSNGKKFPPFIVFKANLPPYHNAEKLTRDCETGLE
ncbi:hypothetical protein PI126_g17784 [Phytophthora idaei]|nr:hypothetical protein PI126_g17784 [Phytophthora idaei]